MWPTWARHLPSRSTIQVTSNGLDAKIMTGVNINDSDLVPAPNTVYNGPKSLEGKIIGTFPVGSIQDTVLKKWLQRPRS